MQFKMSLRFLDYAGKLMAQKEFVQMRHLVEAALRVALNRPFKVHPYAFKAYFELNYKTLEDLSGFESILNRPGALVRCLLS